MNLWIDDIRNSPDGDEWITCRTVTSAVNAMQQFVTDIERISFDHDISHQISVGNFSRPLPCDETFRPAANFLGLLYKNYNSMPHPEGMGAWEPIVTIHSANPVGAREIYNILLDYGLDAEIAPLEQVNRLETTI